MAQITKQKVMEMAVTLAAGVLSNTANGRMIIDSYSGISNTLQDCVLAVEGAALSLGYEVVLELEQPPFNCYTSGVEQTNDDDDVYNNKGEKK